MTFAGVWCREKLSGGQAEVEHCHLIHHLPEDWLIGEELSGVGSNAMPGGGVELLQVEAALHRLVSRCAGRPDDYAVKLKVPPTVACRSLSVRRDLRLSLSPVACAGVGPRAGSYHCVACRRS